MITKFYSNSPIRTVDSLYGVLYWDSFFAEEGIRGGGSIRGFVGWFIAPITDVKTGKNRSMRLLKNEALPGHAFPARRRQQERIPPEESTDLLLIWPDHVRNKA